MSGLIRTVQLEYAPVCMSADRRLRKSEDVVLDSCTRNHEDHPVTRRDESDITAVELAALHRELAVDPLRWISDFAAEKHWHSSDAVYQQLQRLIQMWSTYGTYDQLNLGGVAAMEELTRQIQSYVDAFSDPDNTSWCLLHVFYTCSRLWFPSLRRHVARQIKEFRETEPAQQRFRGRAWWNSGGSGGDGAAAGGKVQARVADFAGRGKADKGRARECGKGRKAVGGGVVPQPAK